MTPKQKEGIKKKNVRKLLEAGKRGRSKTLNSKAPRSGERKRDACVEDVKGVKITWKRDWDRGQMRNAGLRSARENRDGTQED